MNLLLFKAIKNIVYPSEILVICPRTIDIVNNYDEDINTTVIQEKYTPYTDYSHLTVETTHPYYSSIPRNQLYYKIIHFSNVKEANLLYQLMDLFKNNLTHEGVYIIEDFFNIKTNDKTKAVYDWLHKHEDMTMLLTSSDTAILCSKLNYDLYVKSIQTELPKYFEIPVDIHINDWLNSGLTVMEENNVFEYNYDNDSIKKIVDLSLKYVLPNSVLDVGCGIGEFLKEYKSRGIKKIFGIDNIENTELETYEYKQLDLNEKFNVGKFDLTICLEVAEHLKEMKVNNFIESLTNSSDVILFSAAIPPQRGPGHINCQWPSYWRDKFRQYGFEMLDIVRQSIWGNVNINWWYRQNIFLVVKKELVNNYVKEIPPVLDIIHPECV